MKRDPPRLAKGDGRALPPRDGDTWRMDFSRFNMYREAPPANDSGALLLLVGTAYLAGFAGLAWSSRGAAPARESG